MGGNALWVDAEAASLLSHRRRMPARHTRLNPPCNSARPASVTSVQ